MTLKLNGSSSGSVSIDAPASTTAGADITFNLPVADGSSGQALTTNASGQLAFAAMGGLLQLQITQRSTAAATTSSATLQDMNSVTITPKATGSKFLIYANYRGTLNANGNITYDTALVRNVAGGGFSTLYNYGWDMTHQTGASLNQTQRVDHMWLDAPTYSSGNALIYKSQSNSANGTSMEIGKFTELVVLELASGVA